MAQIKVEGFMTYPNGIPCKWTRYYKVRLENGTEVPITRDLNLALKVIAMNPHLTLEEDLVPLPVPKSELEEDNFDNNKEEN